MATFPISTIMLATGLGLMLIGLAGLLLHRNVLRMIIGFSFLMVSQVQYDAVPEHFSSRWEKIKLAALIVAAVAILIQPRLLLFPFIGLYILFGLVREAYRLFYLGVGKVTGRPYSRRSTDKKKESNGSK